MRFMTSWFFFSRSFFSVSTTSFADVSSFFVSVSLATASGFASVCEAPAEYILNGINRGGGNFVPSVREEREIGVRDTIGDREARRHVDRSRDDIVLAVLCAV